MDFLISEYSLISLFLLGFGAATILPIGSEWLLVALVADGYPVAWTTIVATAGNYLGACTTYAIGWWGSGFMISRIFRIRREESARAEKLYAKWGVWSLLLSWVPIIGDPLCLVAGTFRTDFLRFSVLVATGKGLRYLLLALTTASVLSSS